VNAKYLIPPFVIFGTVFLLAAGELISGTSPSFVAMMSVTLFCIAITYNLLGGLGTFSGILFCTLALRTIVISQFAKVLLFEAADKNLEVPQLSIAVYMTFFFSAMVGIFVCGPIRFKLPRPLEPETDSQRNLLYNLSFWVGLVARFFLLFASTASNAEGQAQTLKSIGLAFSGLLLFSLILAVDERIKSTNGQHSFSRKAFFPWFAMMAFGYLDDTRSGILLPSLAYVATCFIRGYRFKTRHYLTTALGLVLFLSIISPFELYIRGSLAETTFKDRLYNATHIWETTPNWATVKAFTDSTAASESNRESYFSRPGTGVFSRLSLIRADSNMFSACANGYHYGWTTIKLDVSRNIPKFIDKNKSDQGSSAFTGRVTGLNADTVENSFIVLSVIGDAFGGFGWWGIVIFPFVFIPVCFILVDSMFDIRQPWGTVALGLYLAGFAESTMGWYFALIVRNPIMILVLSYLVATIVRMIPMRGDKAVSHPRLRMPSVPVKPDLV
jgi:hypothetical protein